MIDMQAMIDRVSGWIEFARQYWLLDSQLNPTWTVIVTLAVGVALALWGARLLRTLYVLAFLAGGAAVGMRLARHLDVDLLIGLVLGGGVLALVGHLLYRWWVGMTAGLCAVLIVAGISAPWVLDEAERFKDELLNEVSQPEVFLAGLSETVPAPVEPVSELGGLNEESPPRLGVPAFIRELAHRIWQTRGADLTRLGAVFILAGLFGIALGVICPRLTTIAGTSLMGVSALAIGVGKALADRWPKAWEAILAAPGWYLAGTAVVLLVSLAFQTRSGKLRELAPVASEEESA